MGSSSQEQIVDQHSADVDPNAWMSQYPVGTVITSNVYGSREEYEVVSLDEWTSHFKLPAGYLPVKLIKSIRLSLYAQEPRYDGFKESHIDSVVSKPQRNVPGVTVTLPSWSLEWVVQERASNGDAVQVQYGDQRFVSYVPRQANSLKPQPKFGWWG